MVAIIGMGSGSSTLTIAAKEALYAAEAVIGSGRMTEAAKDFYMNERRKEKGNLVCKTAKDKMPKELPEGEPGKPPGGIRADAQKEPDYLEAWQPDQIVHILEENKDRRVCVLFSGDTGLYSGATGLIRLLKERKIPYTVYPGVSSVQLMSAAMGEPWEKWKIVSAHGRGIDPSVECGGKKDVLFLTGGTWTAAEICREISREENRDEGKRGNGGSIGDHGIESKNGSFGMNADRKVCVGSDLGTEKETLFFGTAEEAAKKEFPALSVLLVRSAGRSFKEASPVLLTDGDFLRKKVPMTKQEVRAAVLLALLPRADEIIWDIGAGTGSISIEIARHLDRGCVYAIEKKEEAVELICQNAARLIAGHTGGNDLSGNKKEYIFGRLRVLKGDAPEVCTGLPAPDAVVVGGSGGRLMEILDEVKEKNPEARMVVTAILTETLSAAEEWFEKNDIAYSITQVAVSHTKNVAGRHMMQAENPVWIIARDTEGHSGLNL